MIVLLDIELEVKPEDKSIGIIGALVRSTTGVSYRQEANLIFKLRAMTMVRARLATANFRQPVAVSYRGLFI